MQFLTTILHPSPSCSTPFIVGLATLQARIQQCNRRRRCYLHLELESMSPAYPLLRTFRWIQCWESFLSVWYEANATQTLITPPSRLETSSAGSYPWSWWQKVKLETLKIEWNWYMTPYTLLSTVALHIIDLQSGIGPFQTLRLKHDNVLFLKPHLVLALRNHWLTGGPLVFLTCSCTTNRAIAP